MLFFGLKAKVRERTQDGTVDTPAGVAVADYRITGNLMTIFYTEVPLPLRGRGYGYHLVCGALQKVRRINRRSSGNVGSSPQKTLVRVGSSAASTGKRRPTN